MNTGHSSMAEWGFTHIEIRNNYICLDIGCGGGANVKRLLAKTPVSYTHLDVYKRQILSRWFRGRSYARILFHAWSKSAFGDCLRADHADGAGADQYSF